MDYKRVYVLGAGSSIGHSGRLFPSIKGFFSTAKKLGLFPRHKFPQLEDYTKRVLGGNIYSAKNKIDIEALFTHIEIELERGSSVKLLRVRQELLDLIQRVLIAAEEKTSIKEGEYQKLHSKLEKKDTVITFNWDLLLDNVLNRTNILQNLDSPGEFAKGPYWQFIWNLSGSGEQTWKRISVAEPYGNWNPENGYYLKAHGSIDWFYCLNETCRAFRKVFARIDPDKTYYCSECHERLERLLIPPVLNKEYRQYPLIRRIWNVAAKELSSANELIVWGYSLPPADFHSAWLLRRSREAQLQRLVIINPDVFNKDRGLGVKFVRKFYEILRPKLPKESITLYESFDDYFNDQNILIKYNLGGSKRAYKNI